MALVFLPELEITPVFEILQQEASPPCQQRFVEYVANIWIYEHLASIILEYLHDGSPDAY